MAFYFDGTGVLRLREWEKYPWLVHGFGSRRTPDPSPASSPALTLRQIHSAIVRVAGGGGVKGDALLSAKPGQLLGVKTADCLPILVVDPRKRAVAAVHAGWRGTYAGVVLYAVERLTKEYHAQPESLRVAIGPAAAACCYEVGSEVIEGFKERFTRADELFAPTREGHALIDLLKANQRQLTDAGVDEDRIHTAPLCTMCRTDLFFSYRKEKQLRGKVGRLMAVIGRRQE